MVYRRIMVESGPPLILNDGDGDLDDDYVPKKTKTRKRKTIESDDDDDDFCMNDEAPSKGSRPNETTSIALSRPRRAVTKKPRHSNNSGRKHSEQPKPTSAYGHTMSPLFKLPRELRDQIWAYVWSEFTDNATTDAIKTGPSWCPESIVAVFPPDSHPDFGTLRGFEDPLHGYRLMSGGPVGWIGDSNFWLQTCRQIHEEGTEELNRHAEFIVNLDSKFSNVAEFFNQPFIDARRMRTLWIPRISISLKHLPGHEGYHSRHLRQRLIYSLIFHDKEVLDILASSLENNQSITTFKMSVHVNVSEAERERFWYGLTYNGRKKLLAVGELDANFSPLLPMLKELKALKQLDISIPGFDDVNINCDSLRDLCTAEFSDGVQQLADLVLGKGAEKKVEDIRMEGNNWGNENALRFVYKKK